MRATLSEEIAFADDGEPEGGRPETFFQGSNSEAGLAGLRRFAVEELDRDVFVPEHLAHALGLPGRRGRRDHADAVAHELLRGRRHLVDVTARNVPHACFQDWVVAAEWRDARAI